ncbi:MAG TPA: MerR family transcriptional regulator [Prolixibacteraceae bacterium]|nr:MerR family transcriptional regulator [Prolixibacteraceae bacterium]
MKTDHLIPLDVFCTSNDIEISFISSLHEAGLIEITTVEEAGFFDTEQLQQLDRYLRFYYELNINLEGIDAIKHLLNRVNEMHDQITALKNRLRLYESDFH